MKRIIYLVSIFVSFLMFSGCSEKEEVVIQKIEKIPSEDISVETIPVVVMHTPEKPVEKSVVQETTNYETILEGKIATRPAEVSEKTVYDTSQSESVSTRISKIENKETISQKQGTTKDRTQANVSRSPMVLVPGECLIYRIKWNFASVGKLILACKKEKLSNRDVYHIVGLTIPEGIWTKIGNGYNRFDSYIDGKTNLPFYYYNYSASPSTSQITKSIIDHNTKTLTYEVQKFKEGKQYGSKSGKIKFSDILYDGLSSMYVMRGMVQEEMPPVRLPVGITKITNIYLYLLKKGTDCFPVGERQYLLIQSESQEDAIFKKGKLFVSISADEEKLPLLFKGNVPLGTATVELVTKKILDLNFPTDSKFLTEILISTI